MLSPEQFAILPWGWTPSDAEALEGIRACGFNLAGFIVPDALDAVHGAGLRAIVSHGATHVGDPEAQLDEEEIDRRVCDLVRRVGDHPAAFGYYLRDEPGAGAFPGLGRWAEAYGRQAPQALAYISLFPNYANEEQLEAPTYEEYLRRYVEQVHPRFLSYDNYSLMDDGSLRHGYFENLEAVRRAALDNKLPFWNIVLGNAHFHYADPTEAGLRFQLYTTLASGARGISYFTYFTPAVGNYRLGAVDPFGHRTPTWEMLRRVNLQAHRVVPELLKARSVNVFHHPEVPEGCSGLQTSRYLSGLEGGSFFVGEFEGPDARPMVLVVNKSLQRSTPFRLHFRAPGPVHQVNAWTGRIEPWGGENDWLAAGQGMLLCLTP